MFKNTPFESIAKSMTESAGKFNPVAMQDAIKPIQDNLKAWGDLAQSQAQVAQASIAETFESFKSVKEPQAAFEVMKASAEHGIATATQNLKDVTALSVAQFNASVEAIEKAHPAHEAFASVAQSLKVAASNMENTLGAMLEKGAAAVATSAPATAKKARTAA
jgi:hypothetical protein